MAAENRAQATVYLTQVYAKPKGEVWDDACPVLEG